MIEKQIETLEAQVKELKAIVTHFLLAKLTYPYKWESWEE